MLKTLTLMYIEDEPQIRYSMTKTLEILFKSVFVFENAEEALLFYKKQKPDMILSDIHLAGMDGIAFAKEIRKIDFFIPIILLSAYTNKETLLEATQLKLVNYLVKPVVFDELYNTFEMGLKELSKSTRNDIFQLSETLLYNKSTKLLYEGVDEIHLTSSEHRLLDLFINNIGKTLSSLEIKDIIWNDPYDATDSALKSLLSKLRSKIGKKTIKNVSGMGYYLVADCPHR